MRYSEATQKAPPGAGRFQPEDLLRLDRWALRLLLATGAGALPPRDVHAALDPSDFAELLTRLDGAAAARAARAEPAPDREAARRRVVGGAFWLLVYQLEPDRWDALARVEAVSPGVLAALPRAHRVLEVAAGTGRLTASLAARGGSVVAVEPSRPLGALLRRRVPQARLVAGLGQALPVRAGWADLVVSCASFGPDPPLGGASVLAELERCARPGGVVALVGPESPGWFEARGYELRAFPSGDVQAPADLADFFGPRLQPPSELLLKRL